MVLTDWQLSQAGKQEPSGGCHLYLRLEGGRLLSLHIAAHFSLDETSWLVSALGTELRYGWLCFFDGTETHLWTIHRCNPSAQ